MAGKNRNPFICQDCGAVHPKWAGKCDACDGWNTLVEEVVETVPGPGLGAKRGGRTLDLVGLTGGSETPPRCFTGIGEFDRVCGGGLVPGSVLLVGGDPGIGKSTLMLQVTCQFAQHQKCVYVSGEEAVDQVRLRAARLGLTQAPIALAAATSVRDIIATLDAPDRPDLMVIDSIQTMYVDTLDSAPGTVGQVRASAHELIRAAKKRGTIMIIIGHVTKEGAIAGPRVLEHMVDTVLYFEGERGHQFRILRAVKNRFGATDEIGVFEMADQGLREVTNPSALFLADRQGDVSGACVFAGIEGTRPVLVEIQALVSPSSLGTPRRAVVGWDSGRLAMVLAVLETRCGVSLAGCDVYLNVAGGLRIMEPAADLAVAAALVSAMCEFSLPAEMVIFGEIGLGGEVRPVAHRDLRLKEAAKLGFGRAWLPSARGRATTSGAESGLELLSFDHLSDIVTRIDPDHNAGRRRERIQSVKAG